MSTPETFMLRYNGTDRPDVGEMDALRAALFGHLVRLAQPLIEHYQSDLYHDASWVQKHVEGPLRFFYGADDCGTAIGTDLGYVALSRKTVWRVDLTCSERGKWDATLTEIEQYDKQCAIATVRQGLTPVVEALTAAGIAHTVDQTGGFTMVVTVPLPDGKTGCVTASDEGDERFMLGIYADLEHEAEDSDSDVTDNLTIAEMVDTIKEALQP